MKIAVFQRFHIENIPPQGILINFTIFIFNARMSFVVVL